MTDKALSGTRVLEFGQGVSVAVCGKILADLGADVIKIEEPVGDETRSVGPFKNGIPHPERSALYLALNCNKQGVTLNARHPAGVDLFRELVQSADVLVENNAPGKMKELGLDYDTLRAINPGLIMTAITPFGQSGPYAAYKSYYLNTFHASGEGYQLPSELGWRLYPDREPIKVGGYIGEYDSAVGAAVPIMAALYCREADGLGQHIDVSQQEVLLGQERWEMCTYNDGWIADRATRAWPVAGLMHCKDGFVLVIPYMEPLWNGLMALMGNPAWSKEERYSFQSMTGNYLTSSSANEVGLRDQEQVNEWIEAWAREHTKEEIYYGLQENGCAAGMMADARDMLNSRQLQAREFFVEVEHPEVGRVKYAGAPYKLSATPWALERPAPLLGQHNEDIYVKLLGHSVDELTQMRRAGVI